MNIDNTVLHYILLLVGGGIAGFVNIIAGGGSLLTLPILIGLGLPAAVANGTNRISVLLQDMSALIKFFRQHRLFLKIGLKLAIPTVIGAIGGTFLAVGLSTFAINLTILILLVLMIIYVVWQPQKWDAPQNEMKQRVDPLTFFIFILIGIYAGFIQAAATLIWFMALIWRMKVDMVTADALKIFLNFCMTPIVLVIFIYHHQVAFVDGLILGIGSFIGGWIGARAVSRLTTGVIRILMLIILGAASVYMILKMFHLL